MKEVKFFDYGAVATRYQDEIRRAFDDVLRRGAFILQRDLEEFEQAAAEFLGVRYFLGVADGTNAIILALHASGIRPGDRVIVPSHTYVASAAAIHLVGAMPVYADCGADHLIDIASVGDLIDEKTKAIMPVHLNGRVCDMDGVSRLAAHHRLKIVEDAAQAFGARFKGRSPGSGSTVATSSFYPAKVLGCFGDGGGVSTEHEEVYEFVRRFRNHGRDSQGNVCAWGTNSRLDNLQAAFLLVFLRHLPENIARRREIAQRYHEGLAAMSDLTLPPPPTETGDNLDIFQNYEVEAGHRESLRAYLEAQGIKTIIQWGGKPVTHLPHVHAAERVPNTDRLFQRCFLLPMNHVLRDEEVDWVIESIHRFYEQQNN